MTATQNESEVCSTDTCSSVAKALTVPQCDLRHAYVQNCGPTVDFINTIDMLFGILNSRYVYARGFKH